MVRRPSHSPAEEEGFGLVAEIETSTEHAASTSSQREPSSPVLAWYILVWTQPSSVAFTECWDTLLFHLDLVAGQPRRTSLAPLLCLRHINFYVGVTASQKFM